MATLDRRTLSLFSLILLTVFFLLSLAEAAVFSIDYGTDWYKVALVKGKTLDIVLNADSQRKTAAIVTIRNQKRAFGSEAANLETRFPAQSYPALKQLLGRKYTDLHSEAYRSTFQNTMREDPKRGTVVFVHQEEGDKEITLSIEELVAMQLVDAKKMAESTAKESLKDVLITVPPYFNQFERQAVLDAAEIAGLRVLQLMHDNTAVALNYAMTRTFTSKPTHHIFYDSGAGSTVASLISFANTDTFYDSSNKLIPTAKGSKYNKTIAEIELRSVGYDRTLGGKEIDLRLQKWLAEEFTKKHGKETKEDITANERAMRKLLKEARRVKIILSANTETTSSVEGLLDNIDFKTKVTREKMESLCADLFDRVTAPLDTVLKGAGITVADVESLVLVGGNVRVPAIQEALKKYIGVEKIAKNVNGDEAAALGAAFRAAGLSRQFAVPKEIKIKELNSYPIEVKYDAEKKSETAEPRVLRTTLFNEKANFGSRKIMNFKKSDDFAFDTTYSAVDEKTFGPSDIYRVAVSGLTSAIEKYKNVTVEDPKVKVTMLLSDSGMLVIENGVVMIETEVPEEKKDDSLKGKIMSFFGSGGEKNETGDAEAKVDEPPATEVTGGAEQQVVKATEDTSDDAQKGEKNDGEDVKANADAKTKRKSEKISLTLTVEPKGVEPMAAETKTEAIQRQSEMDKVDRIVKAREEARNNLESYIYRIQEWLYEDSVSVVSTEQQRDDLRAMLSKESSWLYEDGDQAEEKDFVQRLKGLNALEEPIAKRHSEYTQRPLSIQVLRQTLAKARSLISDEPWTVPELHRSVRDWKKFPTVDLAPLTDLVKETEEWLSSMELSQSIKSLFEDAVFESRDVENKGRLVQASFNKVLAKAEKAVLAMMKEEKEKKEKKEKEMKEKAKAEKEKEEEKKQEETTEDQKVPSESIQQEPVPSEEKGKEGEESKVEEKGEKGEKVAETKNDHAKDEL